MNGDDLSVIYAEVLMALIPPQSNVKVAGQNVSGKYILRSQKYCAQSTSTISSDASFMTID